jgi:hypothetical protein
LNGEGLHHLRYSAERERSKPEQMLKFRLLPLGLEVIAKSGTVQESSKSASSYLATNLRSFSRWTASGSSSFVVLASTPLLSIR